MNSLKTIGRTFLALVSGMLSALAGFGLLLGLAWLPAVSVDPAYKTATTIVVAGLAFGLGGYTCGQVLGNRKVWAGLVFGLLFGSFAFTYILIGNPLLAVFILMAALSGALGGWLAETRPLWRHS
ncbi:MAG: hypothetical protein JXB38_09495 [Anaerolineales bacterium]|nr:hypothetical protein [Anaerolineales bacterium]